MQITSYEISDGNFPNIGLQLNYICWYMLTSSMAKFSVSSASDDNSFSKKYCRFNRKNRSAVDAVIS